VAVGILLLCGREFGIPFVFRSDFQGFEVLVVKLFDIKARAKEERIV